MAAATVKKMPVKATGASALSEKAMLVKITIHQWYSSISDSKASKETTDAHQAQADVLRSRKRLVDNSVKTDITAAVNKMRNVRDHMTLPWEDGGWRIVSSAAYFDFVKQVNATRDELMSAVNAMLKEYPAIVKNEKIRQGTLFDSALYPTAEQVRLKYGVSVAFQGIPSGEDIRLNIGDTELVKVRQAANDAAEETLKAAVATIWGRFAEVVGRMVERLNAYAVDEKGKVSGSFRDSLVTNITELLDVVPALNITSDQKITAFAARIRKELAAHTPDELRDSPMVRKNVAAQAQDILDKMNAFLQ